MKGAKDFFGDESQLKDDFEMSKADMTTNDETLKEIRDSIKLDESESRQPQIGV